MFGAIRGTERLCVVLALLAAGVARGHIVPPEKLHPVAESYRRAMFILNLNPVRWDDVARDAETIAEHWRQLDAAAADAFADEVRTILQQAMIAPDEDRGITPMPRREAAERVFVLLTKAVGAIELAQLDRAARAMDDPRAAEAAVREAQGVLAAFDDTCEAVDAEAYRRLGMCWLEMSSAMGSTGLLGQGVVAADRERFARAAGQIAAYVRDNYGEGFAPRSEHRLAPYPLNSPTFDAAATLPIKLPPGHNINKQLPRPRQILNMAVRGVDESETALIALGDMGFDSPYIFGEPARSLGISCNTCHNKSITNPNFTIPGLSQRPGGLDVSNSFFAPHANNGHFDPVDIPDLRGIRFLAPYGRNGRFESLREFTRNVIVNEFNGPEPDPMLLDGMVAYMFEFDFLPNPNLDGNGRLTAQATDAARRGEEIFHRPFAQMGGMSCASCHVPSAQFVDHKRHDVGTVRGTAEHSLDRALDTPTLLGTKYTPPYFHDGSAATLRDAVVHFNEHYDLRLTDSELADLTTYVEAVGEGVDAYEDTVHTLEAELEEFSFFLSAYETLKEKGKRELISTTFQTIALEIRAHKWDVQDYAYLPVLDELAGLMDRAYEANEAGDVERVRALVQEYRALYARHAESLH